MKRFIKIWSFLFLASSGFSGCQDCKCIEYNELWKKCIHYVREGETIYYKDGFKIEKVDFANGDCQNFVVNLSDPYYYLRWKNNKKEPGFLTYYLRRKNKIL